MRAVLANALGISSLHLSQILDKMATHYHQNEKHIDVGRGTDGKDTEFDTMRDRFESEMKRVENEMARLREEFESELPRWGLPLGHRG